MPYPDPKTLWIRPDWQAALAPICSHRTFASDRRLRVWRTLPERKNATLDLPNLPRLHVKLYNSPGQLKSELHAFGLLQSAQIPTIAPIAWGFLPERQAFLMTQDLATHKSAQSWLAAATPFHALATPTARFTASLHNAGLCHRDLYLCHFFLAPGSPLTDLRLIDVGRVFRPRFFATRWIVKDLAQFRYSAREFHIPAAELDDWLATYLASRRLPTGTYRDAMLSKVDSIARHDAHLRQSDPTRNISLPPPADADSHPNLPA